MGKGVNVCCHPEGFIPEGSINLEIDSSLTVLAQNDELK